MNKRKVVITPKFDKQFEEFYDYISKESPQNAEKFVHDLQKQMKAIEKHPKSYPPITNFDNITQRYRFKIFMKSFKIVFKVLKKMLIFVGLLHTSQGNLAYKKLRTAKYD